MTQTETYAVAFGIAYKAHEGQLDAAGDYYFKHLQRVAEQFYDYDMKTVAILHDILEDTWMTEDILYKMFPKRICDAVVALTRKDDESYKEYIERLSKDRMAVDVKIADLNDNMNMSRFTKITDYDIDRLKKYNKWRNWLVKFKQKKTSEEEDFEEE